ncbi:winged helix-turn-helix transcriptional regulator [Phaeovulum vinaykumarii]|uniref:Winged helix-turn-helix DNA-binding n=1 Tax=Phaeovulum vinaykumarii TaxID=407234 RepID=A0A1N7N2H0_9RHOB|nr:winged helix-turn-helix transcriptional regulator [Phaeovulum vinaykumarii]SIS92522.1 Winged helix-turn-helix DNA-binding [Phaeovulum vinaykumarii]SOC18589.1 winged helix-turn-helix DNA-binding protein [Phaeovulum vinaykumarii]
MQNGIDAPQQTGIVQSLLLLERALPAGRPVPQPGNIRHMNSKLQEDTHFRVLRLLRENPEMSQCELARAVGISIGGMHYVLAALIDKGFVKLGNHAAA